MVLTMVTFREFMLELFSRKTDFGELTFTHHQMGQLSYNSPEMIMTVQKTPSLDERVLFSEQKQELETERISLLIQKIHVMVMKIAFTLLLIPVTPQKHCLITMTIHLLHGHHHNKLGLKYPILPSVIVFSIHLMDIRWNGISQHQRPIDIETMPGLMVELLVILVK